MSLVCMPGPRFAGHEQASCWSLLGGLLCRVRCCCTLKEYWWACNSFLLWERHSACTPAPQRFEEQFLLRAASRIDCDIAVMLFFLPDGNHPYNFICAALVFLNVSNLM